MSGYDIYTNTCALRLLVFLGFHTLSKRLCCRFMNTIKEGTCSCIFLVPNEASMVPFPISKLDMWNTETDTFICKSECMHDTARRSTRFYSWMFITQAFQNFYIIYRRFPKQARVPGRGGGGLGGTWVNFCWVCPIIDPILVTFGQICNFRYPNLVTFYRSPSNLMGSWRTPAFCLYWTDPFFRLNEEHLITSYFSSTVQTFWYVC